MAKNIVDKWWALEFFNSSESLFENDSYKCIKKDLYIVD